MEVERTINCEQYLGLAGHDDWEIKEWHYGIKSTSNLMFDIDEDKNVIAYSTDEFGDIEVARISPQSNLQNCAIFCSAIGISTADVNALNNFFWLSNNVHITCDKHNILFRDDDKKKALFLHHTPPFVAIPDIDHSRKFVLISNGRYFTNDLNSTNGTFDKDDDECISFSIDNQQYTLDLINSQISGPNGLVTNDFGDSGLWLSLLSVLKIDPVQLQFLKNAFEASKEKYKIGFDIVLPDKGNRANGLPGNNAINISFKSDDRLSDLDITVILPKALFMEQTKHKPFSQFKNKAFAAAKYGWKHSAIFWVSLAGSNTGLLLGFTHGYRSENLALTSAIGACSAISIYLFWQRNIKIKYEFVPTIYLAEYAFFIIASAAISHFVLECDLFLSLRFAFMIHSVANLNSPICDLKTKRFYTTLHTTNNILELGLCCGQILVCNALLKQNWMIDFAAKYNFNEKLWNIAVVEFVLLNTMELHKLLVYVSEKLISRSYGMGTP